MPRYRLKKRAERQEETRQRIVREAVALHETIGPARTTISDVARRAGVERVTVYRHFPDDASLYRACAAHYFGLHPPPDPSALAGVVDPRQRLHLALSALYAYYEEIEPMATNSLRDAGLLPEFKRAVIDEWIESQQGLVDLLSEAWPDADGNRRSRRGAIDLALDFGSWQLLVRRHGLTRPQAVDLMSRVVECALDA